MSLQGANKTETKGPQIEVRLTHKIQTFYELTPCRSRAAQLEKLESKIEHLVHTLSHQQGLPHGLHSSNALSPSRGQPNDGDGKDSRVNQTSDMIDAVCCNIPNDGIATPSTHTLTGTSPSYTAMSAPLQHSQPIDNKHAPLLDCTAQQYQSIGTSLMQAEILLDRYRRLMAPELPFVAIPSHMTAQHLYTEKPLLLRAIVTVTYFHNLPEQRRMVKMMMRDVSERVLLNSEKNIGIVQAILVRDIHCSPKDTCLQAERSLLHGIILMCSGASKQPTSYIWQWQPSWIWGSIGRQV